MVKRSYEKEQELPTKKNIVPPDGYGGCFDDHMKRNQSLASLGPYGDKLIGKFIKENQQREKDLREREKNLWEYKHSKPPISYNPWKPSNHIIEEFMVFPADKIHAFKPEQKKKFLNQDPFRIPKKDGDYFYDRKCKDKVHYGLC